MKSDGENDQERLSIVTRHVVSRNIVGRVEPLNIEKKDLLPGDSSVVEIEKGSFSVSAACLVEENLMTGQVTKILNFAETSAIAPQVPPKYATVKTEQRVLPIIKTENQDGVKEKRIPAMEIASRLAEFYQFATYERNVYLFEANHYMLCNNKMLEQIIYSTFKRSGIVPSGYKFLQDVRDFLILETMSKRFTLDDTEQVGKYIGFKDGYLHLDTLEFVTPNPAIFMTNYLEVNYHPYLLSNNGQDLEKICCPNFDQFITDLSNNNPQIFDRIYEMIGYILSNDCAAKKLFVLGGAPDSGKSRLGRFIQSLFNEGAVCSIPIGELGERFSLGDLPGKALCVDLDLPATKINNKTAAKIKSLTGGDPISVENKFDHRKTCFNRAKLLYATNHPIKIDEREYVLRDRFVYIPIMRSIPKAMQRSNLLEYFEGEKLLIVMKSIGYYLRLIKKNYHFTGDFPLNSAFIHNSSGIAMPMGDMISKFVTEKCLLDSFEQWEYADVLYKSFCEYCGLMEGENDYKNFSRIFHQLYIGKIEKGKKRRESSASPISVFKGITVKKTDSVITSCNI